MPIQELIWVITLIVILVAKKLGRFFTVNFYVARRWYTKRLSRDSLSRTYVDSYIKVDTGDRAHFLSLIWFFNFPLLRDKCLLNLLYYLVLQKIQIPIFQSFFRRASKRKIFIYRHRECVRECIHLGINLLGTEIKSRWGNHCLWPYLNPGFWP